MTESLYHSGVKGMKWGIRKNRAKSIFRGLSKEGRAELLNKLREKFKGLNKKGGTKKATDKNKDDGPENDHDKANRLKKKKISELSNDELTFLNKRDALESSFRKNNPTKSQKIVSSLKSGIALYEKLPNSIKEAVSSRFDSTLQSAAKKIKSNINTDTIDTTVETFKNIADNTTITPQQARKNLKEAKGILKKYKKR